MVVDEARKAEERAAAEAKKVAAKAARPFIEEHAREQFSRLAGRLTADTAPTFEEFLDIRAAWRALKAELRKVNSQIDLYAEEAGGNHAGYTG